MASHQLIEEYLTELANRLPADAVDELADGLHQTWRRHLSDGLTPTDAARAAIVEFGTPRQITAAFVKLSPGRHTAILLLGSGPVVGACWAASLITARAWTWPIPTPANAVYGAILVAVVAMLLAAATTRHNYRRTRVAIAAGLGIILLDATMLTAVAVLTPVLVWPMVAAIPASLTRIAAILHLLPSTRV